MSTTQSQDSSSEKKALSEAVMEISHADTAHVETALSASLEARAEALIAKNPKRKWQSYIWDSLDKSPEERKFIFKLDCALMTFACLGYFIKYLDQSNINNAFVSGMKEDLSLYGNELNYMQTCWSIGYVFGGLPSNVLLTRVRPSIFVPCIELVWSVLTAISARCNTAQQFYVVRFFVGLSESALYPGMIYIIGSWYRSDEIAKRTCIFQMMAAIGPMFSGYLAAAVYNLGGIGGFKGWQWLFLVDGIISIPIAVLGFLFLPDVPEITRAWYFTKEEIILAKKRMLTEGRAERKPYTKAKLIKIFTSWHWWCIVPLYVCWNNGTSGAQPVWQQWLKASTDPVYTVQQINVYPTITGGVQVFSTLVFAWTSDSVLKGRRWPALLIGAGFNIMCFASLWYWNIPTAWRWACYSLSGIGASVAGIAMSWAHEICTADNEERAIVTGSMNQLAYVFQIWVPLLAWQQVDQPRYSKGFALITILNVCLAGFTVLTLYFHKRDLSRLLAIGYPTAEKVAA